MGSQDTPMLSSSSSHRLPTISASQALQSIQKQGSRAVSTGLSQLNRILAPQGLPGRHVDGGLVRGNITEVFGPSGAGKTAFGIQAAVNALRGGHSVVWVDAAAPLVPRRFNDVLFAAGNSDTHASRTDASSPPKPSLDEMQSRFHHRACPTLAHLLAFIAGGELSSSIKPPNMGLLVIDSLSTLLDNAYPRNAGDRTLGNKSDQARWAAGRKFAVINELISKLTQVAAMHDIALLLTCQTITRMRGASRALLVPAISGTDWENGISTRVVLFRDWIPGQGKWNDADSGKLQKARYAGVVKLHGVTLAEEGGVGNVVPFAVETSGLCDINVAAVDIAATVVLSAQTRPPKRRFTEIEDSENEETESDELYGWIEDDAVAAEGLLVDEDVSARIDVADSRTNDVPDMQSEKVVQ